MRWRQIVRVAALGAALVWVVVGSGLALAASAAYPGRQPAIRGADVVAALAAGRSFDRSNVRITGNLDLSGLRVVRAGLRCRDCVLQGSLLGPDVRFNDVVDLSGSTVTGRVDIRGAVFARGMAWRGGVIDGVTRASLAAFDELVDADGLVFAGPADFTGAQFLAAVSFSGADFGGPAQFSEATFGGAAVFTGGAGPSGRLESEPVGCPQGRAGWFGGGTTFSDAIFASGADFRGRCFHRLAVFSGVNVRGSAAFDNSMFVGKVVFVNATVVGDLTFLMTMFVGDADLTGVVVGANLRFDQATFAGELSLSEVTVTRTLSFQLAVAGADRTLQASGLNAGTLILDPQDITWVSGSGDQIGLLQQQESEARASGQTDLANESRYVWLEDAGDARPGFAGLWDRLVYRQIAGYLVRPLYPLRALAILLAAGTISYAFITRRPRPKTAQPAAPEGHQTPPQAVAAVPAEVASDPTSGHPPESEGELASSPSHAAARHRMFQAGQYLKREMLATWRAIPRSWTPTWKAAVWRRAADETVPAAARWVIMADSWIGKALIVVFLMCLANANPTLHQFVDSLLGSTP